MCTYIKKISARRYIALTASVKLLLVVQKRLGMYKFVRTKSHTVSNFSKIFFELLYRGWIVVVHLCFGFFSVASDGATTERQISNRVFWSISYQFDEG